MTGKSSEVYDDLRDRLIKALSNIEAKIDFPEEEIPEKIIKVIKKNIDYVTEKIQKILNDQKVGERIREGFKIAIIGPTNVGK